MEESIPKYNARNKKVLTEAMRCAIKDEILPILYSLEKNKIPDNENKEEVVNGVLCYCFHVIIENAKKALGLFKRRRKKTSREGSTYEEILEHKIRSRDAGTRIANAIMEIKRTRSEGLEQGVLQNREESIIEDILDQAEELSDGMKKTIFNTNKITRKIVIENVNNIINQNEETNILKYIEHADNDIANMEERRKKLITKKMRELFRLSPKRALKYYVDVRTTPNCPIPMNEIRDELADRWQAQHFNAIDQPNEWQIIHKLKEEDKEYIINKMKDRETFMKVITSRDITSAHGTDGIGYWALKLTPELGSEMMTTISKIIIKYGFMPTTWQASRTILLYKKGNENELCNWRPLTIASCLYRTWTCALASCLQDINRTTTKLFDNNQKGFIKGIDGCLEHSNMITEAICDANRRNKDIYIATLDLKDAFGSVPHAYIKHVMREMNFPEEISTIIEDSYDNGTTRVRIGSKESALINIHKGVKQGCPLSPLIFNFCMNPLLSRIDEEGEGYYINENCRLTIQAYADDLVIFADTREGLQANLNIVEEFLRYSKIQVNANKCHTISYVYRDRKRIYEEEPFIIANENIPVSNLAESIEYLGIDATTTNKIRKHGAMAAVEKMCNLIRKIGDSTLSLNQKIYAIKTFAIPQLDYILINKRINNETADDIDRLIRTTINNHIKGVKLPISLFYTHWKDGGLSILKIKERAICLRAKTFMALFNSKSEKTRNAMRAFVESERRFRNIKTINNNDEVKFLDWKIEDNMRRGTDTITIHALRSVKKLGMMFKVDPDTNEIYPDFGVYNDENGYYKKFRSNMCEFDALYLIKANAPINTEAHSNAQV